MADTSLELTELLNLAARGDTDAAREVFPALYEELRKLAAAKVSGRDDPGTLGTTALVHEAYLRIVPRHPEGFAGRRHFFFAASRAMHDLLVEDARRRSRLKRGGRRVRVPLEDLATSFASDPVQLLALHGALERLESEDAEGHRIVLLRFHSGLDLGEIAPLMSLSLRTVERRWRFLRAWLAQQVDGVPPP